MVSSGSEKSSSDGKLQCNHVVSVPVWMDVEHEQKSWCALNTHTTIALPVQGQFGAMLPMCRSKSEHSRSHIPIDSRSFILFSSGAEEAGCVATLHCQSKTVGGWVIYNRCHIMVVWHQCDKWPCPALHVARHLPR